MSAETAALKKRISELEYKIEQLTNKLQIAENMNFSLFQKQNAMSDYIRALEDLSGLGGAHVSS